MFYIACLAVVAMVFAAWGRDRDAQAQSQPDVAPPAAQSGETASDKADETSLLKTQKDQVNYAIGVHLIGNLKRQEVDIDLDLVIKGMQDAYSGKGLLMPDAQVRKAFRIYQDDVRRSQAKIRTALLEKNRKQGEAFLAENMKKEGVVTLPSGLQYRIIRAGEGKMPADTDMVECHYRGTRINGEEFNSSYRRGRPSAFKVDSVIPGWKEALKLMAVGSKWEIFIPSQLAYGERGSGNFVEPGDTVIFETELLAIK
ncbi:MAG: FKBP-type peptidyl-prolyl cis-trans isomerase [Candidatus Desulfacyla sp.]